MRLRRTIDIKQDKFKIQSKETTKKHVQEMLESAGFSHVNPYNIVRQGTISQMSQMSDEKRLKMLKDVGGASTYEAKRKESEKKLHEINTTITETDESVRCHAVVTHPSLQAVCL